MQGLMLKLSNVDPSGERALRVVAFFDQLAVHHPDLESVVRSTAVLADCVAGLSIPGHNIDLRFDRAGTAVPQSAERPPSTTAVPLVREDGPGGGSVWLERETPGDLDEFILERMALTVTAVLARSRPSSVIESARGLSDPALAHLLVNERASDIERGRAARLMGLDQTSRVELLAIAGDVSSPSALETLELELRDRLGKPVYFAQFSEDLVLGVAVGGAPIVWESELCHYRAASGPMVTALDAPRSWSAARSTLRFAGLSEAWPSTLSAESVGPLHLLTQIPLDAMRAEPDVQKMAGMAKKASGRESLRILDLFLHTDSIRSAARLANFHHSTVHARLKRIEAELGIPFWTGAERQRVTLALLLWQLSR